MVSKLSSIKKYLTFRNSNALFSADAADVTQLCQPNGPLHRRISENTDISPQVELST